MKRALTVIAVMAVLLVGAPWVIGNVAEQRVNRGLDAVLVAAPYLEIVDRKYTQGWFRSEMDATFAVRGPVSRALSPASIFIDRSAAVGAPPDSSAPARFTVHSEILHGPVLGLSGLGLARVNWHLVLDEKIRTQLVNFFGTDEPVQVSTRIGFLADGTTSIVADGRVIRRKDGTGSVSWDPLEIDLEHSGSLDKFALYGDWDRFEARDDRAKYRVVMRDMKLKGFSERVIGKVYDTDADFSIGEISYVGPDQAVTGANDVRYAVETQVDGDFASLATKFGSGPIDSPLIAARGLELQATHYDVTVRHLHVPTLAKLLAAIDASYLGDASAGLASVSDQGLQILRHDPEFVVDRIGIETQDGAAVLKGVVRLKGVTPKDLQMGGLSLIPRLDAELRFETPRKLVDKIEGGAAALAGALQAGYVEAQGDKLVSRVEFHDGELQINGNIQDIPGLGAPANDAGAGPE